MRYLPTVNLWNNAIHSAIVSGQLTLIPGQWIQCGAGRKSRFVSVNNGVINAVHWSGTAKATNTAFILRAALNRLNVARLAGRISKGEAWLGARALLDA